MRRWLEYTPRGDSLDPIWLRLRTWRLVAQTIPHVLPWGRRPLGKDLRRYQAATGVSVMTDHAFNEYLEVVYEYGMLGVLGVLAFMGLVAGSLWLRGPSDPWSLSLLVWALTMMGSITLRTWPFPALGLLLLVGAWL